MGIELYKAIIIPIYITIVIQKRGRRNRAILEAFLYFTAIKLVKM